MPERKRVTSLIAICLSLLLLGPGSAAAEREGKALPDVYRAWLEEDVVYIISPEEREVFLGLSTNDEREAFIEQFWRRRDPTPETAENEFRLEHYRRIAYANEQFSAGIAGWKTDRGRIYIRYGPPDRREVNPTGGTVFRQLHEGGGDPTGIETGPEGPRHAYTSYPYERWEYRYIEGIGSDVAIEFVDKFGTGLYELAFSSEEKNAFAWRYGTLDPEHPIRQRRSLREADRPLMKMTTMGKILAPPPVHFKDLAEIVNARISYRQLPASLAVARMRITNNSYYVPITIEVEHRHLKFRREGEVYRARLNLYGEVHSVQRRLLERFEESLDVSLSEQAYEQGVRTRSVYQKRLILPAGRFALKLVLRDELSGAVSNFERLIVNQLPAERLALSTLILADIIRPARKEEFASDPFVIGSYKVVPNLSGEFRRSDKLGLYFQVYGAAIDQSSGRAHLELKLSIRQGERTLYSKSTTLSPAGSTQGYLPIIAGIPLSELPAGDFVVGVEVRDSISGSETKSESSFRVL